MFEQTFVEGVGKTNRSWTIMVSFLVQFAAVTVLIILPLIYFEQIKSANMTSMLVAPPPPPPPPPPPAAAQAVKVVHVVKVSLQLVAPKTIPKEVKMIKEEEVAPPSVGVPGGVPGGVSGGTSGGVLGGILGGIPSAAPPPPPPPKVVEKPKTPASIRVGGNVQAANILRQVKPPYPPLARQARIQGTVRFNAVIGKDGHIQNLQLVSGHPLLVAAATQAVEQWVYKPTLLNDVAVDVITTIDVNFTLNQ